MKRPLLIALVTGVLMVFTAGPAFAAHCVNLSKKADAGNHMDVLVTPTGSEAVDVTMLGNGGYADVWIDVNMNYELDQGDFLEAEDVQVGKNHSPNAGTSEPWVNPGAINKLMNDHATLDHGMGLHPEM